MRVFFDSSAFAKRYLGETGSDAVIGWCDKATEIVLSGVALPEIISAFCRLRRAGLLSETQYRRLKGLLLADIADVAVCDLSPIVMAATFASLEGSPLRAIDAIHIGSAVALKAAAFVTADKPQSMAARRSGLKVAVV